MARMKNRIFSTDSAKAIKAQEFGYLNAIHYLAPSKLSGFNLCSLRPVALPFALVGKAVRPAW